jgi:NAD(P)-dependent dehydrogenase (short-subunit alcohol dehydrogenase family)
MHIDEFRGRVVVVTGGPGGIGRAYGRRFLQEGAHVLAVDIVDYPDVEEDLR